MNRRALCVMVAVAALAGCSDASERDSAPTEPADGVQTVKEPATVDQPTTSAAPMVRPDPVHDRGVAARRMRRAAGGGGLSWWRDPRDASVGPVDVVRVSILPDGQAHWYLELAARPPLAADVEPGLVIAYGLVVDTNGDAVADHVVGIDNDAAKPRDFRVWVTDLATGETEQQLGAPYGYPIEFSHPGERGGPPGPPMMVFTFLGDAKPADLNPRTARFYAWTSATRDGKVLAYDYAPDTGWITAGPP